MWHKAAVPVRHIDKDLADRCFLKADSWVSPEQLTEENIKGNRIGICQVWEDALKLFEALNYKDL
ncbi:MAG: hypothetical protein GY941_17630 [Planctomycetes bacterium]|nr:hypothetical protein [Planctomycetota bacterium]